MLIFLTVTLAVIFFWIAAPQARTRITDIKWLDRVPGKWLSLHAGVDLIDPALKARYPEGLSLDLSNTSRYLPAANQTYDTVFLVLAAHQCNRAETRERLFIEIQRVLKDSGRVILVEHLRDARNLAVFGPAAFHFLSLNAWLKTTRPAGLTVLKDQPLTPLVHALVFAKQCALR